MMLGRTSLLLLLAIWTWVAAAQTADLPLGPTVKPAFNFGRLHIQLCGERTVRVLYDSPNSAADSDPNLVVVNNWSAIRYAFTNASGVAEMRTAALRVQVDLATEIVTFRDAIDNSIILQESGRTLSTTSDLNEAAYTAEQRWVGTPDEGIYGGGQLQNGIIQYRNTPLRLVQSNTEAVIPVFTSTRGFALLWDNNGQTYVNSATEQVGSTLTTTTAGRYGFRVVISSAFNAFGGGFGQLSVKVTLQPQNGGAAITALAFDSTSNSPAELGGHADLPANTTYTVSVSRGNTPLYVHRPDNVLSLRSPLARGVNYYFFYGKGRGADAARVAQPRVYVRGHGLPSTAADALAAGVGAAPAVPVGGPQLTAIDHAIALFREAAGGTPLYARWVFGFWQCQERYHNQKEILSDAHEYRTRKIPVDNIVQDWQYWGNLGWGPQWDSSIFPDPAGMVAEIHGLNMQVMVSVWSKFDSGTTFITQLNAAGGNMNGWADLYNPAIQTMFYGFAKKAMFDIGVDALWLDATEPEGFPNYNARVNKSSQSGNRLFNPYSLLATQAIADGLHRDYPDRRVFSLTRSAWAGQQRTGGAVWSGDIDGAWGTLAKQVSASINYQLSGMPYWSEDMGGFFRPNQNTNDYHDTLVRWVQFGVFTPVFRIHGSGTQTAIWRFGADVLTRLTAAVNLRYRLLPYIYTLGSWVTRFGYTLQRGLALDFADDAKVYDINDEFSFGPALLVAPMVNPGTQRQLYLPAAGAPWTHFWTGNRLAAGSRAISVPIDQIAVYVKAGAVLPLGPYLQYWNEKAEDPLELRIYAGADGAFTLYEDDGVTRKAETAGAFAEIDFTWADATQTLTIGARRGSFTGMLATRTINVVLVSPGHGVGLDPTAQPDAVLTYTGAALAAQITAKPPGPVPSTGEAPPPTPTGTAICATASEGQQATLNCPAGNIITAITFASYGLPSGSCPSFDTGSCDASSSVAQVTSACVGKSSCSVAASNDVFGDPCSGTGKNLNIAALCNPGAQSTGPAPPPPATTTICGTASEGQQASLSCPAGKTITAISFASYGLPSGSCPSFTAGSCHASSSVAQVQSACVGKSSCSLAASNNVFGDPCSGRGKTLDIAATCA